ncbi:hypothetical protein [Paracoccus tibetensis]|uniref:O-antigen ligase like membrane protein n=1 Tax=Paracoccus tibetensis TaxID=336292 RepID=A0A1G5GSW5_9RHOB|nr:hypothetical protein [Paracoccus tibetensis]SCY53738.1 hypothetical protein SAMN05660710_01882 [Paracoccus tibetensis]
MGNTLSTLALLVWPVVVALLFSRLDYRRAAIWSLVAGYLLLPPVVTVKAPILPGLGKDHINVMAALVGVVVMRATAPMPWLRMEGWIKLLLAIAVITPFITVATNGAPIVEGVSFRPGLSMIDALYALFYTLLDLVPFLIGYMILSSTDSVRLYMRTLVLATLAYSLPMLLEVRLSPQLNVWIYGFFAHDFSQSMRYGGFRPMVFLEHGLWVALFTVTGVLSAAVAYKEADGPRRLRAMWVLLYLLVVLVMCKSAASLMYGVMLVPVILMMGVRWQMRLAGIVTTLVLLYPFAMWAGLVPVTAISDYIIGLDAERGQSLLFRFENELVLLERASQKFLAGWGSWNRHHVVDPFDGRIRTITDGQWIIYVSTGGFLTYIAMFGLLCGSVIRVWRHTVVTGHFDRWTVGMTLIVAANLVDLIPNATLTPVTWLAAGALAGLAARGVTVDAAAPQPAGRPAPMATFRPIIG